VLTDLKNRGVATSSSWSATASRACPTVSPQRVPATTVQTCIIHLIRNTFRYASRKYWDQISRELKPVYSAPTIAAAETARDEFLDSGAGPTRRSGPCG
jgi:putative transposase